MPPIPQVWPSLLYAPQVGLRYLRHLVWPSTKLISYQMARTVPRSYKNTAGVSVIGLVRAYAYPSHTGPDGQPWTHVNFFEFDAPTVP